MGTAGRYEVVFPRTILKALLEEEVKFPRLVEPGLMPIMLRQLLHPGFVEGLVEELGHDAEIFISFKAPAYG